MTFDYKAMRAAQEARMTLAKRLRETPATGEASRVMGEAADAIDYLHAQLGQLRKDLNEEVREAGREVRAAATEAYWQGRQGEDFGSY